MIHTQVNFGLVFPARPQKNQIHQWLDDQVSYQGKHYSIKDAYCEPKPDPKPTLIVGGGSKKTMRLAARFADWWNIPDAKFEVYAKRVKILRRTVLS